MVRPQGALFEKIRDARQLPGQVLEALGLSMAELSQALDDVGKAVAVGAKLGAGPERVQDALRRLWSDNGYPEYWDDIPVRWWPD